MAYLEEKGATNKAWNTFRVMGTGSDLFFYPLLWLKEGATFTSYCVIYVPTILEMVLCKERQQIHRRIELFNPESLRRKANDREEICH